MNSRIVPALRLAGALVAGAAIVTLAIASAHAANVSALYDNAKRAIATGNVVPERDLAPLIAVLRKPA